MGPLSISIHSKNVTIHYSESFATLNYFRNPKAFSISLPLQLSNPPDLKTLVRFGSAKVNKFLTSAKTILKFFSNIKPFNHFKNRSARPAIGVTNVPEEFNRAKNNTIILSTICNYLNF